MKNLILFFSLIFIFENASFSQEVVSPLVKPSASPVNSGTPEIANELPVEGTYQIVFKNGTAQHAIDGAILFQVNHRRTYENVVIIFVDENTQINVLPYKVIHDPNFVPVPTYIFE